MPCLELQIHRNIENDHRFNLGREGLSLCRVRSSPEKRTEFLQPAARAAKSD